jgi:hypothetical protein
LILKLLPVVSSLTNAAKASTGSHPLLAGFDVERRRVMSNNGVPLSITGPIKQIAERRQRV